MYLSRYNSDSLDYECQHTATILWTINATNTERMISSAIGVNRDTSYKSSSKCQCRDTSITIKQALNQSIPNTKVWFQPVCFNEDAITLHCNQSRVSILTSVILVYMLQVKVNRHNYNSTILSTSHDYGNHVVYYITVEIGAIKMNFIIYPMI